jgi:hypothetical protein
MKDGFMREKLFCRQTCLRSPEQLLNLLYFGVVFFVTFTVSGLGLFKHIGASLGKHIEIRMDTINEC